MNLSDMNLSGMNLSDMNYDQVCEYLFTLPRFEQSTDAYKPGLDKMYRLMEAMGEPHKKLRCVHVAGTNGKGSTSAMVAAMLHAQGYNVGLYTSPHLFDFAERTRINGQNRPHESILKAVRKWQSVFQELRPSFFEAITALMFDYFAEQNVDFAVIETGLGGRLDATNIITPILCLITNIGYDHTAQLGTTLPSIAGEKGGIIKPNIPILTTVTQPEVRDVLQNIAQEKNANLTFVRDVTSISEVEISLEALALTLRTPKQLYSHLVADYTGAHQAENVRLAVAAAEMLGCTEQAIRDGLGHIKPYAGLRGRLDVLHTEPLIVADVAHNAEGLETTLAFIQQKAPQGQLFVVFGAMKDKSIEKMARLLVKHDAVVLPVEASTPRAFHKQELAHYLASLGLQTHPIKDVADAILWFKQHAKTTDTLLITGSHLIVAQISVLF